MIPKSTSRRLRLGATVLALACVAPASAATFIVSSISDLQSRIVSAVAGDLIIVANGTYTTNAPLTVNRVGTAAAPIVIAADSIGGVTIGGTHGFVFSSPAAFIEIDGFRFTHANSINLPVGTHHLRLTRNFIDLNIAAGADVSYLNISGDDIEIDRNELANKTTLGNMLDVTGTNGQVARRLWVHHNYFHDFTPTGGNGAETIRWGLSGLSLSTGDGRCEHNLFVRCQGENELISNKSSGNTYRFNTILDSPGAQLTLRHGNDCLAYGNYLRNTDGLRVFGDRHQIFSNHFDGNTKGVDMGNGDGEVADGAALTSHDRPDNVVVAFNTFVNNTTHYQMGGRTNGLGATNITFANNLIQDGGTAVSISGSAPYANPTWSGNLLWNVTTIGSLPASGHTIVDPLLAADANGVYHLQSGSPAIDAATGTFAAVTVDLDGQPRPGGGLDLGADEVSTAAVSARLLTAGEVGPSSGLIPPATVAVAAPGGTLNLDVAAAAGLTVAWQRDGRALPAATTARLTLTDFQPADAGLYTVTANATAGAGQDFLLTRTVTSSDPQSHWALVASVHQTFLVAPALPEGVRTAGAVVAADTDIRHPNGNIFDQFLLTGAAATVASDPAKITRLSYVDLNGDIVQVEFSSPGTLTIVLENPSGPAPAAKYHQPGVAYMQGHARLYFVGTEARSHLSVFSVGRLTAFDPTGAWDLTRPVSATNDPLRNGNPIFPSGVDYDGRADVAVIALASTAGAFGGVRGGDAAFFASEGLTGVFAPGVAFAGPVVLHDITVFGEATPVLETGPVAGGDVFIAGGSLDQANARALRIDALSRLVLRDGTDAHARLLPAQANRARIERARVDVTAATIVNPGTPTP